MTIFWVDNQGVILRATSDDSKPIAGATAIKIPPNPAPQSGQQVWDFGTKTWGPVPPTPPDPDDKLDKAIDGAANLTALKAVLKGRVKARPMVNG